MNLRLADPWPAPLGFLAALIVVALIILTYRSLAAATDRRARFLFTALRLAAGLLLVLLLLDPVLTRDRLRTESLGVVVMTDRSHSMRIADSYGGRPRYRVAAEFLSAPQTGLVDLLEGDFEIMPFAFDREVRVATPADLFGETMPAGILSDLSGALKAAGQAAPRSEIVGVVLLTDGAENAGGDAREAARELGIPVYAVAFGSGSEGEETRRDLAITSVDAPETAFAENTVVAEAVIRSTGYDLRDAGNRKVRLVLKEDEREVDSKWVEFTETGIPVRVSLRFVPSGIGRHTYHAEVAPRGDEVIPGNNRRTFSLNVLDRRASVLYFDATMRWEAKFLRDFLARDQAVELTSVLHSGQGRQIVNGDPHGADLSRGLPLTAAGFESFDVIILGDVEAAAVPKASLTLLRKRVETGGGLLVLGGYHSYGPGGYAGSPLEEVLPVFIDAGDGQRDEDLLLDMTPEGRVHAILSGLSPYFTGKTPPGLEGLTLVRKEKPGASVLLTARGVKGGRESICMAAHRYGEGRVVAFTGDTSWVWYRSADLGGPDGLYRRFWGQTLRWLLEKDPEVEQAGEPLVVFTDRPTYRIGESVRIRSRVLSKEGKPVSGAALSGKLEGPGGAKSLSFGALARVPGHYEARILALTPGAYTVSVSSERKGVDTQSAQAGFVVEEASVESDDVEVDVARLQAVARVSGGRFYASPKAGDLATDLKSSLVGLVEHQEFSLSNTPLFFLLFVALTGLEWYLRRRRNLL
jgi:uncharacterized membrane protein